MRQNNNREGIKQGARLNSQDGRWNLGKDDRVMGTVKVGSSSEREFKLVWGNRSIISER
jgi:hypothetical protein